MPIYEFVCADCGHEFESLQRLNEAPPASCPNCGGGQVNKKISVAGFRLKGGGWYETDFKNKKKADGGSSGATSDSGGGSGASTGSKPSESASGSSE
ncbi:MAG: zinc ribbon domain-containing protein [Pseudomonadota bacterium]